MKTTVKFVTFLFCFFALLGIAGGIDNGADLSTAWIALPVILVMIAASPGRKRAKKH